MPMKTAPRVQRDYCAPNKVKTTFPLFASRFSSVSLADKAEFLLPASVTDSFLHYPLGASDIFTLVRGVIAQKEIQIFYNVNRAF